MVMEILKESNLRKYLNGARVDRFRPGLSHIDVSGLEDDDV